MVYKKYLKKEGKLFGPYYYESYRENGKVKKRYLGRTKPKRNIFLLPAFITLLILLILAIGIYFGSTTTDVGQKVSNIVKTNLNYLSQSISKFISPTITGRLTLDFIDFNFLEEPDLGNLEIRIKQGELIPGNAKIIVEQPNKTKEFALTDFVELNAEGDFYVQDKDLEGQGQGYGFIGEAIIYPTINFDFNVIEAEEIEEEVVIDDGEVIEINITIPEEPAAEEPAEEPVEEELATEEPAEEPVEEELATEEPAEEPVEEEPAAEEPAEEPVEEELATEEPAEEPTPSPITGEVIADDLITGSVSKEKEFRYNVGNDWIDVISVDLGEVDDLSLRRSESWVVVTTDYSENATGFGEEFLMDNESILNIPLNKLEIEDIHGLLTIKLVYDGTVLSQADKEITAEGVRDIVNETVAEEIEKTAANATTRQYKAIIGRPVKWVKKIEITDETTIEDLTIELPKEADNISIKTDEEVEELEQEIEEYETIIETADREDIVEGTITGLVSMDIVEGQGILTRFFNWLKSLTITGHVVLEEEIQQDIVETENATIVDIEEIVQDIEAATLDSVEEVAVEYYTEAPQANETLIGEDSKRVVVHAPDELNYTEILAYTTIYDTPGLANIPMNDTNLRLYWYEDEGSELEDEGISESEDSEALTLAEEVEEALDVDATPVPSGIRRSIDYEAYDLDDDGYIDYIEWIVPHLSAQIYEIIYITKANHLDSNKEFISDIYDEVSELDGVWSEPIYSGEYVRVTFEIPLDNSRDITLYARSNGSANIEVYEEDGNDSIAVFENIADAGLYKVYLTGLIGAQDVFDLKVISDNETAVEFDYIVDPLGPPAISFDATTDSGIVLTNEIFVNLTTSDDSDHYAFTDFNNDVLLWMPMDSVEILGTGTVDIHCDFGCEYLDFEDDLVTSVVPEGGGGGAYKFRFTSGPDSGNVYTIIDASDEGSWASLDYFELSPTPSVESTGETFEVFLASGDVKDNSTYGNNGTSVGNAARTDSGYFGKGFSFDGDGDAITVPNINASNISFSVWIKNVQDLSGADDAWIYDNEDWGDDNGFAFILDSASPANGIKFYVGSDTLSGTAGAIAKDTWHHVACTFDSSTMNGTIYIDGAVDKSKIFNAVNDWTSNQVSQIGSAYSGALTFNGTLDDFLIFNRTFTPIEVAALYNASANSYEHTYTGLDNTDYSFTGYAVDAVGNVNSTAERTVTVQTDLTAPEIDFDATTDSGTVNVDNIFVNLTTSDASDHYAFTDFDNDVLLWMTMDEYLDGVVGNGTVYSDGDYGGANGYIDFSDDLVPNLIPEGSNGVYKIKFTSGADSGNEYVIIDAYDQDSWNGKDWIEPSGYSAGSASNGDAFDIIYVPLIYDNSSYGNNGTAIGNAVQTDSGYWGKGFEFDGDGDYIDAGIDSSLSSTGENFSVSLWVNQKAQTANAVMAGYVAAGKGWMFYQSLAGTLGFFVYDYADDADSVTSLALGTWTHLVGVSNSTHTCLYKNGAVPTCDAKGAGSYTAPSVNGLWLGAYSSGDDGTPGNYFNGTIDDVIIFNRSLTAEEVGALYNATATQYENNFTGLSEGDYSFTGYAVDSAGNVNSTAERTVTVQTDLTAPEIDFDATTDSGTVNVDSIFVNLTTSDASDHYAFTDFDNDVLLWMTMDSIGGGVLGSSTVADSEVGNEYIDFLDDLVPSPVPIGGGSGYQIEVTSGVYSGNIYSIIDSGDQDSWYGRGNDYFLLSPTPALSLVGSTFNVFVNETIVDNSSYGNDGDIFGDANQTALGYFGKGFSFDGNGDYVGVGNQAEYNFTSSDDFAVSLWFKSDIVGNFEKSFAKQAAGSWQSVPGYSLNIYDGDIYAVVSDGGGDTQADMTRINTGFSVGVWTHVIMVYYGNDTSEVFVNGVSQGSDTATSPLGDITNANSLVIGADSGGTSNWNGSVDDVMIFNRSLSLTEISALYNASATQYENNYTSLTDGNHSFTGYAVDTVGNVNTTAERTVTVQTDLTAPEIDFDATTDSGTVNVDNIFVNLTTSDASDHYAFTDFDNDVVLWMTMDNVNGSGDPLDNSSYGNDGVAVADANQTALGYFGKGFSFDGNGDYVDVGNVDLSGWESEGSASAWIYDAGDANFGGILSKSDGGGSTTVFFDVRAVGAGNNDYRFYIGNSTNYEFIDSSNTKLLNTWQHVAVTWNSTTKCIYVNGTPTCSDLTYGFYQGDTPLVIGKIFDQNLFFNGSIDDILLFNRSLSSGEIGALYNASATQYENNYTSLTDGNHSFTGYAVDTVGNVNSTAERTVTVSTTSVTDCKTLDVENRVYEIQNDVSATGNCFTVSANNVTLDLNGYNIVGNKANYAVAISGYNNTKIRNGTIANFTRGISSTNAYYSNFSNLTIDSNSGESANVYGIYMNGGGNNNFSYLNVTSVGGDQESNGASIYMTASSNNIVELSDIHSANVGLGAQGIYINLGTSNIIRHNQIYDNTLAGIYMLGSSLSQIVNNTISNNDKTNFGDAGINILSSHSNVVENNNLNHNSFYGIRLHTSWNNSLTNNDIFNVTNDNQDARGIFLFLSDNNSINSGVVNLSEDYGIYIDSNSEDNNISIDTYQATRVDVYVAGDNNRINGSFNSGVGIEVAGSGKTVYLNGDADFAGHGFNATADNTIIDLNGYTITGDKGSSDYGAVISGYNSTQIRNGNMINFSRGVSSTNGYYGNFSNLTLDSYSDLQVYGIYIGGGGNNNMTDIDATTYSTTTEGEDSHGIHISSSSNNLVDSGNLHDSAASGAGGGIGLYVTSGDSNTIQDSIIYSNRYGGVYLTDGTSLNQITNNNITGNDWQAFGNGGIMITDLSYSNTVAHNTISSNYFWGVYLFGSWGNSLANNSIFNCSTTSKGCIFITSDNNTISSGTINLSAGYGVYVQSSADENNISIDSHQADLADVYVAGSDNRINGSFNSGVGIEVAGSGKTVYLNGDASFTGYGINVTANDVAVDLNGYTITGDAGVSDRGVYINGYNHTNISNGAISNFADGVYSQGYNGAFSQLDISALVDSAFGTVTGIYFNLGGNNNITGSEISVNNTGGVDAGAYGMYIQSDSDYIAGNNVSFNSGDGGGRGIFMTAQASETVIMDNILDNNQGPSIDTLGSNVIIFRNNISSNGAGIWIRSNGNNVTENNLSANLESTLLLSNADNNTINDNSLSECELNCISLSGANLNIFERELVNGASSYGISISGGSGDTSAHNVFRDMNLQNINQDSIRLIKIATGTAYNNSFINVSYNNESVAAGCELIRKWYYAANITDADANAVAGVTVIARNASDDAQFSVLTNASGQTAVQEITEYVNLNGTVTNYGSYMISISNDSYVDYNKSYDINYTENNLNHKFTLYPTCLNQCTEGGDNNCDITADCALYSGLCTDNICDFGNFTINSTLTTLYAANGRDANDLVINLSGEPTFLSGNTILFSGLNETNVGGDAGTINFTTPGLFNTTSAVFTGIGGYATGSGNVGGDGGVLQLNYWGLVRNFTDGNYPPFTSNVPTLTAGNSVDTLSGNATNIIYEQSNTTFLHSARDVDVNGNGLVDINDISDIASKYNVLFGEAGFVAAYDINVDDKTNVIDISRVGFEWGSR